MTTAEKRKNGLLRAFCALLATGLISATLVTQSAAETRNDDQIQNTLTKKLTAKNFRDVRSSVEGGTVTLTGTVDIYQSKLDAAKLAQKAAKGQRILNSIIVAGPNVPDAQLEQKLAQKLRYVRVGYDNMFDYFALNVKDGVVTVEGQDLTGVGRDEALADIQRTPGVKDVIANISLEPFSPMDNGLRLRAARALYRDSVLGKYALDPARPIRIIVDNGHLTLYGSVENSMDKTIAGIRANQLFGAFTVENKLVVDNDSGQPGM
ncbi:MAG: BON domain-containing protein [Candidatus Sulfotelmatobacter sp.]